jgi:succinate dehydrogenase/fumarate reductase-like Fe-S protein
MPEDRIDQYQVPIEEGLSIFNVLEWINSNLDPTLAFAISCRTGKCDICLIKVNGKTKWACTEPPEDGMLLEAVPQYEVFKDLVIDWQRPKRRAHGDPSFTPTR